MVVNVVLKGGPLASWVGELVGNAPGAVKYVTLCRVVPEFHVHVTIPPACTIVSRGVNAKLVTLTSTAVGGDEANSVKLAGLSRPVNVALTVWRVVEEPTESVVAATPLALVVLWRGLTAPKPDVRDHVTTTPGTAPPLTSTAVTDRKSVV